MSMERRKKRRSQHLFSSLLNENNTNASLSLDLCDLQNTNSRIRQTPGDASAFAAQLQSSLLAGGGGGAIAAAAAPPPPAVVAAAPPIVPPPAAIGGPQQQQQQHQAMMHQQQQMQAAAHQVRERAWTENCKIEQREMMLSIDDDDVVDHDDDVENVDVKFFFLSLSFSTRPRSLDNKNFTR